MSYIPKKRKALTPNKKGYKKVSQDKTSEGWLPPVKSTPLIVSEERSFRHKVRVKEELRRPHVFQFKIVRDDGVVIDPNLIYSISLWQTNIDNSSKRDFIGWAFGYPEDDPDEEKYWTYEDADEKGINGTWFYRKEEGSYGEIKFNYDTRTQIWTVPFFNRKFPKVRRHKIFWAHFSVKDSTYVAYSPPAERTMPPEYKYKTAEFYQEEDKILPGFYTVRVPYYKATFGSVRTPPSEPCASELPLCAPAVGSICYGGTFGRKSITVESSIPYNVSLIANRTMGYGYYGESCISLIQPTVAQCMAHKKFDCFQKTSGPFEDITATASTGDMTSDIDTNPLNVRPHITPPPYTVTSQEFFVEIRHNGNGMIFTCHCTDGDVDFELDYRLWNVRFSVWASRDLS